MKLDQWPSQFSPIVGFDIETDTRGDSPDFFKDEIILIQLFDGENAYVIRDHFGRAKQVLEDESVLKIIHNSKFERKFLSTLGISIKNAWDSMLCDRVLTAGTLLPCDLASTLFRHLEITLDKSPRKTIRYLRPEHLEYAANDVRHLIRLYQSQTEQAKEKGLLRTCNLENQVSEVVAKMEIHGILFDVGAWEKLVEEDQIKRQDLVGRLSLRLGREEYLGLFEDSPTLLNVNSPDQMLRVLRQAGIKIRNVQEKTLRTYLTKHPDREEIGLYLAIKELSKEISWNYPQFVKPDGRIHAEANQLGARTGRFSYSNPNLQQVAKGRKKEFARNLRHLFIAPEGKVLISPDYSQQEMRMAAELSQDSELIRLCSEEDPHTTLARDIFKRKGISPVERRVAKDSNFALLYGSSLETFADSCGLHPQKAFPIYQKIKRMFSTFEEWAAEQHRKLIRYGHTETIIGRKRWFTRDLLDKNPGFFATVARNNPVQGSAADMMKLGMVYVHQALEGTGSRILLQVHDELVIEGDPQDVDIIKAAMIRAGNELAPSVPTSVDVSIGNHWQ